MQSVTDSVRALVDDYARVMLTVYIDGALLDVGIGSFEYAPSCGSEEEFSFGNACAAGIAIALDASRPDLKDHDISVKWAVNETEHPLFTGRIKKAKVSAGRTNVEAWDEMYYSGSDGLVSDSDTDISAAEALSLIADAMGVGVDAATLDLLADVVIAGGLASLGDVSNSAAAGYIAGLVGGNAVITRSGDLAVRQFALTDWTTEPYEGGAEAENEDFAVSGITLLRESSTTTQNVDGTSGEETVTESFAAGDGALLISNPLADQAAAERAYAALSGISFRPGSFTFPGGLLLEPGDIFSVESMDGTYHVAAVSISMSFDGGVRTTVACGGSVESGGAAGTITQALKNLEADLATIRNLVAENASIVSAKITNLSVEDLRAGKIRSADFQSVALPMIYPSDSLYPADTIFPSDGEEIVRGIEIDFTTGIIRGVFFNAVTDDLAARVSALEAKLAALDESET